MEWTDVQAVAEVRGGNVDAFRVLVDRHSRAVYRLAYRMTGNREDAEDAVQETFLRAFRQLRHFDSRSSFGTWIYRVSTNCTIDALRSRKKREQKRVSDADGDETSLLERQPAVAPSPERLTQSSQLARVLEPALARLSVMERTAFVMRHYEGLGIEEIGRVLEVQPNAAKHTVFRAIQKLRRALEPFVGVKA